MSSSKRHFTAVVNSKRHFTAVVNSKEHGLYISSSPSSAARKIVSKLCNVNKNKKVEFHVREITQGSKKKTYGPYLGEMKKLAKPIELKGRIIRYAPEVHLKKKKTAIKTGKKISKKMRGGDIDTNGILKDNDFLIKYKYEMNGNLMNNYKKRSDGYTVLKSDIDTEKIQPRLKRKNNIFAEPFIFFSPKIREDNLPSIIKETNGLIVYSSKVPTMYYKYVAFNEGRFSKTAKFKQVQINNITYVGNSYSFPDVQISEIPKEALEELKEFIEKKRKRNNNSFEKNTFCNTIYNAVIEELRLRDIQY